MFIYIFSMGFLVHAVRRPTMKKSRKKWKIMMKALQSRLKALYRIFFRNPFSVFFYSLRVLWENFPFVGSETIYAACHSPLRKINSSDSYVSFRHLQSNPHGALFLPQINFPPAFYRWWYSIHLFCFSIYTSSLKREWKKEVNATPRNVCFH